MKIHPSPLRGAPLSQGSSERGQRFLRGGLLAQGSGGEGGKETDFLGFVGEFGEPGAGLGLVVPAVGVDGHLQ